MTYTNATFFVDLEGGSDTARTALTSVAVANNGSGAVRCTKTAHGLVTGAVIDASVNYAGAWIVTVIDANNFDLVGSTYSTSTALTATPRGGSSKADAWKTVGTSGVTSARHAAGDTIRIKASTDETLVGNATWTNLSKTVTLAGAVTANIDDGEVAWTASANVTSTADTTQYKENAKSAKHVIATAFTTGLVAYKATGTLDLSGYQQVSFWICTDTAIAASTLSLRLCSDTAGVTTVNTIAIPAIPASTNQWAPITVDTAGALGSAIASVALYCDLDPGAITVRLDNIIACKASSSADALTLTSLIGKVWNRSWVASTAYASNDIRKPTQPNRTGFNYKVTAGGGGNSGSSEPAWPVEVGLTVTDGALTWTCNDLEETWYPIQSINGVTVKVDNAPNTLGNAGRGYYGTTETVATYKRECFAAPMNANFMQPQLSGTDASRITYTGGWNRTDMTTQTGETWVSMQSGQWEAFRANSSSYLEVTNVNVVKASNAMESGGNSNRFNFCHLNGNQSYGLYSIGVAYVGASLGVVCNNNGDVGLNLFYSDQQHLARRLTVCNNLSHGVNSQYSSYVVSLKVSVGRVRNNFNAAFNGTTVAPLVIDNVITSNNGSGLLGNTQQSVFATNCSIGEGWPTINTANKAWVRQFSQKDGQVADAHRIAMEGGTIVSATDQRNTASGISWKFRPINSGVTSLNPLPLSVAKIACTANVAVTVKIYTRRDNTNIKGQLCLYGGQIAGVPSDVTVACEPSINTWVQSGALTFTPTETGVVEILFKVWDGVGTTNNFWIDDLSVT